MPYFTKYRLEFETVYGDFYIVELKPSRSFAGTVISVKGGSDPLIISHGTPSDNIFTTIKPSEARLRLIADESFPYLSIYNQSKEKDYMMYVFKGKRADQIIQNTGFWGSLEEWTAHDMYWDKETAKGASSGVFVEQRCNFPSFGLYDVMFHYADAQVGDTISIYYNDVLWSSKLISSGDPSFGEIFTTAMDITGYPLTGFLKVAVESSAPSKPTPIRFLDIEVRPHDQAMTLTCVWVGFVQPTLYSEQLVGVNHEVEIIATDCLSELKDVEFNQGLLYSEAFYQSWSTSFLRIILYCLDKTEIYLPVKTRVDLWERSIMTDGQDPLVHLGVDLERFVEIYEDREAMNAFDVIDAVLKPFASRLIQSEGYWVVERIPYKSNAALCKGFHYDNFANQRNTLSGTPRKLITGTNVPVASMFRFVEDSQRLEMEYAWKEFTMIENPGVRYSFIYGEFVDWAYWYSATSLKYWMQGGAIYTIDFERTEFGLKIKKSYPGDQDLLPPVRYLKHNGPYPNPKVGISNAKIWVEICARGYHAHPYTWGDFTTLRIYVWFINPATNHVYQYQPDGQWLIGDALDPAKPTIKENLGGYGGVSDWKTFNVEPIENGYQVDLTNVPVYVWIGGLIHGDFIHGVDDEAYVEIKYLRVKVTQYSGPIPEELPQKYIVQGANKIIADDIPVIINDLPTYLYGNIGTLESYLRLLRGFFLGVTSGTITKAKWSRWLGSTYVNLVRYITSQDYVKQYKFHRYLVSGTILGTITAETVIVDTLLQDKLFLMLSMSKSIRSHLTEGKWVELYDETNDVDNTSGFFDYLFFDNTFFNTNEAESSEE